jgi:N-acetylglucosamine-6-phosphate deacetylase
LAGAGECIRKAKAEGISSSAAHSSASYAQMMEAKEAGLTHLTHFGNAMTGLHHREIGMVGAGLLDSDLMIELICDTIHLCPEFLQLVFSVKPIEQLIMITDSMSGSWIGEGEVKLGGLPVIVKDGQARLKDGGALAGSILRYNEGLKNVVELTGMPLSQLVKATSWNQARSLQIDKLGKIESGYIADIVILDRDFDVWKTLVDGEIK